MRSTQDRRIATESAEEREARLQQLRVVQQQRITAESAEERVARLQQLRFSQQQRITGQQVRSTQDRRIATESAEEREARLQQLRVAQKQRIATETSEEIEARRARDRRNHMDLETAEVPLFQQTRVRFKMRHFHSRLKSVCVPRCVTCLESFPGMNVRRVSVSSDDTECLRCARDKHNPKIYSSVKYKLLTVQHSTCDSRCRRSSRSPTMLSILLVYIGMVLKVLNQLD